MSGLASLRAGRHVVRLARPLWRLVPRSVALMGRASRRGVGWLSTATGGGRVLAADVVRTVCADASVLAASVVRWPGDVIAALALSLRAPERSLAARAAAQPLAKASGSLGKQRMGGRRTASMATAAIAFVLNRGLGAGNVGTSAAVARGATVARAARKAPEVVIKWKSWSGVTKTATFRLRWLQAFGR